MDDRITAFLAAACSCALSPVEHAQVRAALTAHTMKTVPADILQESSNALRLTGYEKAIGKAGLLRFMRANPLNGQGFAFSRWLLKPMAATLSSISALLLIGGGMAYAAEGSLPGDLLYPVKVHITEPVISGLSFTSAGRAQWNIRTIERRLNESDALSQKPDPNGRQVILRSQMEENAANLGESLRGLSVEDRKTIRKNLVSKLAQRRESLLQIQGTTGLPPALQTLVEDAADEPQEADTGDYEDVISSSSATAHMGSSSVLDNASSSGEEKSGTSSTKNIGDRPRNERKNSAQSLLRTLRETRFSTRSSLSISPFSERSSGSPDEEMEEDE